MKPSYTKFMSLIPEKTIDYIIKVFEYLNYYVIKENKIDNPDSEYYFYGYSDFGEKSIEKSRILLSALLGLQSTTDTAPIVASHGLSFDKINIDNNSFESLSDIKKGEIFNSFYDIFCFLDDETKYSTLLPSDIASHILNETSSNIKTKLFQYLNVDAKITDTIEQLALNQHTKIDNELDRDLYIHLPYNTINYINVASKIRSILISKISKGEIKENEYVRNDDTYLVPLSLMLAIYECDENSIEQYLTEHGLTSMGINDKINLIDARDEMYGFDFSDYITNTKNNMEAVKILYKRYWTDGVNKSKEEKDIRIIDIVNNLFDRNFTQSIIVDKILAIAKKTTDDLKDMNEKVAVIEKMAKSSKLDNDINEFYSMINKDTKEFIIFTSKVYQVLLKKVKDNKYNQEFLRNDNDFVTLSLYIASHFYNTDLSKFFDYHDVTFDKVMASVNIQITKEEIEQEVLDKSILLEKFKKIIFKFINSGVKSEYIYINKVSKSISDSSFINSMLMKNIFEELKRDMNLPNNFNDTITEFLDKKKKELEKQEKEEFFKYLPIEDLEYLTNVCHSYNYLSDNYSHKYNDELLVILALLIGLNMLDNNKTRDLFINLGIDATAIWKNFSVNAYCCGYLNIDLLKTKFYKYIFEGRNKDNKSPTIEDIAFNIFNEELYVNIELKEFLHKLGLSYDTFKNPKVLIENYEEKLRREQEEKEQKAKNEEADNWIRHFVGEDIRSWMFHSNDIYNHLLNIFEKNPEKYKEVLSKEKLEVLSIVLSFFGKESKQRDILEKYNLNKEAILNKFDLPINYEDFSEIESKDNSLANVFFKYCENIKETKAFLGNLCKNDLFIELFKAFDLDFDILKVELINGKNYEDTLNIEQRTAYLNSLPVPSIEHFSPMEIITCDSSLGLHATYIQDQYPKLMSSNELSVATSKILELTKGVFTENEIVIEPKGFLEKLFGTTPEIRKEIKLSQEVIKSLKPNLDTQIRVLYDEAKNLLALKNYIEAYYYKNKAFIKELANTLEDYREKLENTDKTQIFDISNLSSYVSVLENKLNTLNLTDTLLMQEFFKLNQAIVNHATTINSLILSRDVLIPLIGTELVVGNSITNELKSIEVTKNIVSLLNGLITQDIAGSEQILEQLKSTDISKEQLLVLSSAVTDQLNQIAIANSFGTNNNINFKVAPRDTTFDDINPSSSYGRKLTP